MDDQSPTEALLVRALTEKVLMGGVPREMGILNGTLHAAFVEATQSIPCAIIALITYLTLHMVLRIAAKKDPEFFECFKRFIKHKKYYGV